MIGTKPQKIYAISISFDAYYIQSRFHLYNAGTYIRLTEVCFIVTTPLESELSTIINKNDATNRRFHSRLIYWVGVIPGVRPKKAYEF